MLYNFHCTSPIYGNMPFNVYAYRTDALYTLLIAEQTSINGALNER